MAHQHPPRFLKIVDDAKTRVRETNVDAVKQAWIVAINSCWSMSAKKANSPKIIFPARFIWARASLSATSRRACLNSSTEMVLYCGGGFRSALAADNLQKMGYTNVISMDGGIRDWREKGYPLTKG